MFKRILLILLLPLGVLALPQPTIIYNPNAYNLTDFQVRMDLSNVILGKPVYLKVTDAQGNLLLYCYEQPNGECTNTTPTKIIWVKVNLTALSNTTIYIYETNENYAVNGDQVFDLYDDFNDGVLDANKWTKYVTDSDTTYEGDFVEENGYLHALFDTAGDWKIIYSNYQCSKCLVEYRVKMVRTDSGIADFDVILLSDTTTPTFVMARYLEYTTDYLQAWEHTSAGWGSLKNVTVDDTWLVTGIWYKVSAKFDVSSKSYEYKQCKEEDGTCYTLTGTWTVSLANTYIGLRYYEGEHYVDWIYVRKYADQDPQVIEVNFNYYNSTVQYSQPTQIPHTYQFTYSYVVPIKLLSNYEVGINNITIPITMDTRSLISQGKMKSDCSDIAVSVYDPVNDVETQVPFWLDPVTCNTPSTVLYVKIPNYMIDKDNIVFVYLGSPEALPTTSEEAFYWFVNFATPSEYNKIDIYTSGTASYNITSEGITITIGTGGKLVIYNK